MDDVVLAEMAENKAQKLLDITDDTTQKLHIEFGMEKLEPSESMEQNKRNSSPQKAELSKTQRNTDT